MRKGGKTQNLTNFLQICDQILVTWIMRNRYLWIHINKRGDDFFLQDNPSRKFLVRITYVCAITCYLRLRFCKLLIVCYHIYPEDELYKFACGAHFDPKVRHFSQKNSKVGDRPSVHKITGRTPPTKMKL